MDQDSLPPAVHSCLLAGRRGSPHFPETSASELARLLSIAVTQHASDTHAHAHRHTDLQQGSGCLSWAAGRVPEAAFAVYCTALPRQCRAPELSEATGLQMCPPAGPTGLWQHCQSTGDAHGPRSTQVSLRDATAGRRWRPLQSGRVPFRRELGRACRVAPKAAGCRPRLPADRRCHQEADACSDPRQQHSPRTSPSPVRGLTPRTLGLLSWASTAVA